MSGCRGGGRVAIVILAGLALAVPTAAQGAAAPGEPLLQTTIGMRGRIEELPLPGSQLRAKPVADAHAAEVIVRVLNVFPHGTGFRYNLEITPLVAGQLDVRDHLERLDGSSTADIPPLPIEVGAVLPAGRTLPNDLEASEPGFVGGYRSTLWLLGAAWLAGLAAILFVGRGRARAAAEAAGDRPLTLADRLQPLVVRARDGELDSAGRADLERLLLAHWRGRLGLLDVKAGVAVAALRQDETAGALLRQLEEWLHRPNGAGASSSVDVAALLAPYRDIVDESPAAASSGPVGNR